MWRLSGRQCTSKALTSRKRTDNDGYGDRREAGGREGGTVTGVPGEAHPTRLGGRSARAMYQPCRNTPRASCCALSRHNFLQFFSLITSRSHCLPPIIGVLPSDLGFGCSRALRNFFFWFPGSNEVRIRGMHA